MNKDLPIDLSKMSLEELQALKPAIDERIDELLEVERKAALEKVKDVAAEVGMSPAELLKHFGVVGRPKKPVKPKYRHPEDPEKTWTGRGRQPLWIKDWLESGKDLDELAI